MDWSKTEISTAIDFTAESKQIGVLRLPHSSNEQPLGYYPIPVAVFRRKTGPTLLLSGGTHGDEYEGPAVLMGLLHHFDLDLLQGRIIVLPALNMPAVMAGTRCSPLDNGNLNRCFDQAPTGGPTAMIAKFVEEILLPECDAVIDFHSGGSYSVYAPLSLVYLGSKKADRQSLAMAQAFGATYLWSGKFDEKHTFNAAALRRNVPMFATELGGGGNVNPAMVELAHDGLFRVMKYLGLLNNKVTVSAVEKPPVHVESVPEGKVHADRPGLFSLNVKPGQHVGQGDRLGTLYSVVEPERRPIRIFSPVEGIVLSVVNRGTVERGELLVTMGDRKPSQERAVRHSVSAREAV